MNIPLLLVASVIVDVDLLVPGLIHRGPAHSLVIVSLLFLNVFVIYGKRVAPYFTAAVQHLLGDYLVGGSVQLLWPVSVRWYGVGIEMTSVINILMEWIFFLTSLERI